MTPARLQRDRVLVDVAELSVAYSPKTTADDEDHVITLMEVIERVPPILVDRQLMTVTSGLHRLEAFRRDEHPDPCDLFLW